MAVPRPRLDASLLLVTALFLGLLLGRRVDDALRIQEAPARVTTDPIAPPAAERLSPAPPLPLRLVDAGGVGIPADAAGWGQDYSHNTRAFHDLILLEPPYVDDERFRQVRLDWERYLARMAAYGNNGVVIGVWLELINFDRVGDGQAVYPPSSPYRQRHRVLRERFGELFGMARARGFQVFLKTDMLTLTEPLARHLRGQPGGLDARRPELWHAYRAGLEELFASLPGVDGVVVRVGEGGPLFNQPGWPYWSEFEVSDRPALRTMLRELLPAFEKAGKLLVLRSWTVGPGPLGDLHTNPAAYDGALGDIDSPSLVVSTKYQEGDFFGFLPLNSTLARGSQRRIVELQARREFEGFGAFPNYMAAPHQRALRALRARNPNIVGTWLWTQDGGPVRAGPLSLYPLQGFWHWIDANVYATSRLTADPQADVAEVTRDWVAREVGADPEVVDVVSRILLRSREPVEQGFYIRPFAERRLRMGGVEVPPLLWIMEWDVVGGWSAVLSTVYRLTAHDLTTVLEEGFRAAQTVRDAGQALEQVEKRLAARSLLYAQLHGSLLYEESLLTTLAWYRSAFLKYYRWLDVGDVAAYEGWRYSLRQYEAARGEHRSRYAGNIDFPAFDFDAADDAIGLARRDRAIAWLARGQLALMAVVFTMGAPALQRRTASYAGKRLARSVWTGIVRPGSAGHLEPAAAGSSTVLLLASCAVTGAALFSFASWRLIVVLVVVLAAGGAGLHLSWRGAIRSVPGGTVPATLAPVYLVLALFLGPISVRGPLHFWFLLWTASWFRVGFVTLFVTLLAWTFYAMFTAGRRVTGASAAAAGAVLAASGMTLLLAGLLLPETKALLGSLHSPLALLPLTFAVVLGIVTYLGVPTALAPYPVLAGLMMMAGGHALARTSRRRSR